MDPDDALRLRALLDARPVAALATLHRGDPAVSMVPFVARREVPDLLIHVSALATHTTDLQRHPRAALLVTAEADGSAPPQALARVALQVDARFVARDSEEHDAARRSYLARFPEAVQTFSLGDFSIVVLRPVSARLVAGFGRAGSLAGDALRAWLRAG